MSAFVFKPTVPGEAFEYAVGIEGRPRIGLVRKEEARTHPYLPTGRWLADGGDYRRGGFRTRRAAAEWLFTFIPRTLRCPTISC